MGIIRANTPYNFAQKNLANNGVRRRNAHIDFGASRNDPAAQFQHVTSAFASLDALTNAVAESFSAPSISPPRTLMDVAIDFDPATDMLLQAQDMNDTVAVEFYESIRQQYNLEQAGIASGDVNWDK